MLSSANDKKPKTYEYVRNEDGTFTCPHCGVVKRLQSTMHEHYDSHHSGSFKHKCKWCVFETSKKQTLDKHIAAKHPERLDVKPKEFACGQEGCSYKCLNKAGLRSHTLLKHMPEIVKKYLGKSEQETPCCTKCGKDFASKPAFIYHLAGCLPEDCVNDAKLREGLGLTSAQA